MRGKCLFLAWTCAATFVACTGDDTGNDAGGDATTKDGPSDVAITVDAGTPTCVADGGFTRGAAVAAFGSFNGADLDGSLCLGGAYAYLETTPGTVSNPEKQLLLVIDTALSGDPTTFQQIANPSDATGLEITFFTSIPSATPGVYTSAEGCEGMAFCVFLPVPSTVDCGDASPPPCPQGCVAAGPINDPICTPVQPSNCYQAQATSDCLGGTQPALGSWTVTLTSVTPYVGDASPPTDYVVHGLLSMTMVGDADASLGNATLTIGF